MTMNTDLRRRLDRIERDMDRIPSRLAGGAGAPLVYYLSCERGNLLVTLGGTNFYGLKRPLANVTAVPTAAPSTTSGATPDGLSPGMLYAENGTATRVWIGVRMLPGVWNSGAIVAGTVTVDDWTGTLTNETPFLARRVVQVPVTGSPGIYAPVYNPWSL